ncbi:hypothetical protein ACX93W_22070 [Paenibacillus sp. CAU 1782]
MHFKCQCGYVIRDITDHLPYKGHLVSDQDFFDLLDEIDKAIENSGPSPEEKEEAIMKARSSFYDLTKTIYQCSSCGNLFFDEGNELITFSPHPVNCGKQLLQSAKGDKWPGYICRLAGCIARMETGQRTDLPHRRNQNVYQLDQSGT